jgi:dTDP-4-amino-4,6-dideoxygalactose transaminase
MKLHTISLFSCGSINPIMYQGATPILVDSEIGYLEYVSIQLEIAIKIESLKVLNLKQLLPCL